MSYSTFPKIQLFNTSICPGNRSAPSSSQIKNTVYGAVVPHFHNPTNRVFLCVSLYKISQNIYLLNGEDIKELKMMFSVLKWTSWAQWYTAITDLKETSKWKLQNSGSRESCFRHSNHRDERNNMLKWETYNLLVNWKETILESSKSRFKRSRSDLSIKNCSNHQLNIPVLNRSRRRFRA